MRIFFTLLFYIIFTSHTFADETFSISYDSGRVVREYPENTQPVIGLALSGGGARGIAHIGVIEVLEENGIHIKRIAGTSMGSVVGGLYAAGYRTKTLSKMFETLDWSDYFTNTPERRNIYVTGKETSQWPLFDLRFDGLSAKIPSSLSSGQNIISFLSWLVLRPTYECGGDFNKLPIPFKSVTTDLNTGNTIALDKGNLARAIQASSTIPLLLTPVELEGMRLVDGGLKNNLPVNIVRDMGSDFVIAVAIDESMHQSKDLENALNVADQATSILMRSITELSKNLADFVITPDMENFSSNNFTNILDIIEQGRIAAREAMPALNKKLAQSNSTYRKTYIKDITVSPQKERNNITEILDKFIQKGNENYFYQISSCLEELWKTGKYFKIQAHFDEKSGNLQLELIETPKIITLILQGKNQNQTINRLFEISSDVNSPQNFNNVIEHIDSLLYNIRSEGFSFAKVTDIELDNSFNNLNIYVKVPQLTGIFIDDNIKSRRSIISREFNFESGDAFNLNNLMNTIDNLYGTNLFDWVYADVNPYNGGVGLSIHLREKDLSVMRIGFRFDETNSSEGRIAFSRENILGFGNELNVIGHSGKRKKLLLFQSQSDRIYKTLYTFNFKTYRLFRKRQIYSTHSQFIEYEDDRYGSVISIGQQMDKLGNAVVQFKTETLWTNFAPSAGIKNEKKELRSFIVQSLIDSYDRYPFPKNGKINIIFIESSQKFFGGTEQFVKLFWGGSFVRTFAEKHTLSGDFSLGTADPSTPRIESFTLGGSPTRLNCYNYGTGDSHFHADFQGLYSEEKYGEYLAVGKLTYRLFIPKYFYLSFIYNIGNVWDSRTPIRFDSLLHSYGVQGSFATYFGPLSIGWGITSKGDDRLYMSAGWEF